MRKGGLRGEVGSENPQKIRYLIGGKIKKVQNRKR